MASKRELLNLLDTTEKTRLRQIKGDFDAALQTVSERADAIKSAHMAKVIDAVAGVLKGYGAKVGQRISFGWDRGENYNDINIDSHKVKGLGPLVEEMARLRKNFNRAEEAIRTRAAKHRQDLTLYGTIPAVVKDLEKFLKA